MYQQLHQLLLDRSRQIHHPGNHLPGEVMEVLRHHDFRQVVIGHLRLTLHVHQMVVHQTFGNSSNRIAHQGLQHTAVLRCHTVLLRFGLLHTAEDFFSCLARQTGNVGQAVLRIRQFASTTTQLIGIPQLVQCIVQLASQ